MFSSQNSQVSSDANYIEDVFSTYLYQADGSSTKTITNGIDLAGEGGLVWIKSRSNATGNVLVDTVRGSPYVIQSNNTNAQGNWTNEFGSFSSTGFTVPYNTIYGETNFQTRTYVSWTFRKQPKFFDVVTYTGNGASTQVISHLLGSAAGCVIVKPTNTTGDWFVYHASIATGIGSSTGLKLNTTGYGEFQRIGNVTSTTFEVQSAINVSGDTYVAYLFAHNAGGFGLTGTDNVISCGSFTTDADGNATVNLGYEPQFLIQRMSANVDDWYMLDIMRGSPQPFAIGVDNQKMLKANSSNAEANTNGRFNPNATGFKVHGLAGDAVHIYIAIRRGPMKVPTSGTSVFSPNQTSATTGTQITTGFPVDWQLLGMNDGNVYNQRSSTRLTGVNTDGTSNSQYLVTSNTNAEAATGSVTLNWGSTGFQVPSLNSGSPTIFWNFRRAPSFFDEVCYTGDDAAPRTLSHNLGVAPELLITKRRSSGGTTGSNRWYVTAFNLPKSGSNYQSGILNGTDAFDIYTQIQTAPTSTTFTLGVDSFYANISPQTYVAYLFATCAGVSKVGSYTGTGTTLQVNCGFTGGARFVLIKRTDSTGDWYVWDTARGIVSGNDPYLLLNSTAAEVTSTDYIDTYSAGFEISSTAPAAINASGGTFIFLAIA